MTYTREDFPWLLPDFPKTPPSPLDHACPVCLALAGIRCMSGNEVVSWFHAERTPKEPRYSGGWWLRGSKHSRRKRSYMKGRRWRTKRKENRREAAREERHRVKRELHGDDVH